MPNEFLIAVKPDLFLCQIGLDGTVTGSAYPSKAWRFDSYERANATCGRLHKLGHRESVVTNYVGRGVTVTDLQAKASEGFLVRLDDDHGFVRALHEREVDCVNESSAAKVFGQGEANALAGKLRRRGFPRATVVEVSGAPARASANDEQERINKFWKV
jgi:hypothetical protein